MKKFCLHAKIVMMACLVSCSVVRVACAGQDFQQPFHRPEIIDGSKLSDSADSRKACKKAPPAQVDLYFNSIYEEDDETRSIVDEQAERQYKQDMAMLSAYENGLVKMANNYIRSEGRNYKSAFCALQWMNSWAAGDALLGKDNRVGIFVRKWSLASLATTYAQIAADPRLPADRTERVRNWLQRIGKRVIADFSQHPETNSRNNNHMYWAAWAVGMTGVAIGEADFYEWAMQKARRALASVQPDGTLPLEMARAGRAQLYHLYATTPLVMLAEIGIVNGDNLYAANGGALDRLIHFNLGQMHDPSYIQEMSGYKQEIKDESMQNLWCWLEVYNRRFGFMDYSVQKQANDLLRRFRPFFNRRLGGDVTMLYGAPLLPALNGQPER